MGATCRALVYKFMSYLLVIFLKYIFSIILWFIRRTFRLFHLVILYLMIKRYILIDFLWFTFYIIIITMPIVLYFQNTCLAYGGVSNNMNYNIIILIWTSCCVRERKLYERGQFSHLKLFINYWFNRSFSD
jgi:hypothetical protein